MVQGVRQLPKFASLLGDRGRMKRRTFLAGVGTTLIAARAAAQNQPDRFTALSGDRFIQGDTEYRLADVMAPPLYTLDDKTPIYFNQSKSALQSLLDEEALILTQTGPPNRWGVKTVIAATQTGDALAVSLVRNGAVRVAPQSEDLARIDRLFMLENEARKMKRGLWSRKAYRSRDANDLDDAVTAIGDYHSLEGVVRRTAAARSRLYLNFGDDYRTDFTASAGNRLMRKWARAGFDLTSLESKRIRVRGFVTSLNGPSIDLTHVRQIEVTEIRDRSAPTSL